MVIYIVYAKGENMTVFINVPVTVEINKLLEGSQNIRYRKWYLLIVNLNTSGEGNRSTRRKSPTCCKVTDKL
jgi:hypothetical protein